MPVDTQITLNETAPEAGARVGDAPLAIEVRGVHKTFRIPGSVARRPFTRVRYQQLQALREISFDVHRGEFFGIVGRNGSGKSTLLKILASIYRPERGRVQMAGRVAPFIELGVGFNPELTARENVQLNGVLMGLSRREAQRRLGAVIEFAELEEFIDLKLKNYSSGMMVRLAFAIMVQADPDILLVDEVLAVGDAAFSEKCLNVFHDRRQAGKTIVLVTHDMGTVQSLCHRAMLLHEGELEFIGAPEEAALRYYRLNFEVLDHSQLPADPHALLTDLNARVIDATLRDPDGREVQNVEQRVPIAVDAVLEAVRELRRPTFVFHVVNDEGVVVSTFTRVLDRHVSKGRRVRLKGQLENRLVAGRYFLDCWIREGQQDSEAALQALRMLQFVVYGTAPRHGIVNLEAEISAVVERP